MKLAVVILNYNGIELLKEFIPKIVKYSTNSKLYLIDNCSSDKSTNYVEKNFPHITIIKHAKNLGVILPEDEVKNNECMKSLLYAMILDYKFSQE